MSFLMKSKIWTFLLVITVIWGASLAIRATIRQRSANQELDDISMHIDAGEKENQRLEKEEERLADPDYLALMARRRLNYSFASESLVFVYDNEKSDKVAMTKEQGNKQLPNWRLWWQYLIGN